MANLLPMSVCDLNLHTKKAKCVLSKAFLEHVVVDLVYKFDEKPTTSVLKSELTAKVPFKCFWVTTSESTVVLSM